MTHDDYDYYYYGLTIYIMHIIEYPWDGSTSWIYTVITFLISPFCGVAQTPDCGMLVVHLPFISLYVVSLRRPTVACLLFLLFISPLCGVAQTPDCGMLVISL